MSSPNEPGFPRAADRPGNGNGNGSVPANGEDTGSAGQPAGRSVSAGSGEPGEGPPPWQRGPGGRAQNAGQARPARESRQDSSRSAAGPGHSPGVDARLNRFVSGGATAVPTGSTKEEPVSSARPESVHSEAYASELPDLSGPVPRSPRKATTERSGERPVTEPAGRPEKATSRTQVGSRTSGPVRASMQIRRLDPWSVLKVSLVLSAALFFVWMIAVAFLYLVLGGMGVWAKLNSNVGDLLTSASGSGGELVSSGTIFGGAALIGLVNIVVLTAMATVGAFIYNLTTDLVGGVEVTLADRD